MKKRIAIVLCLVLLLSLALTGCSKEVTVDITGLKNITLTGAASATTGKEYAATLTPAVSFALPESITVSVDGTALTSGYTYDSATGKLTISGDAITGNITIGAEANETVLGNWEGTIDFAAILADLISETPEAADYFTFEDIYFDVKMSFLADGTCKLEVTEDSVKAALDTVMEQMKSGLMSMFEELLKESNADMSVEAFLAASDIDLDEVIAQSFDADMLEDTKDELTNEGKYRTENGMLYISDDPGEEPDNEDGTPYTLENGVLTIEAPADIDEDMAEYMFPLVLKRVN